MYLLTNYIEAVNTSEISVNFYEGTVQQLTSSFWTLSIVKGSANAAFHKVDLFSSSDLLSKTSYLQIPMIMDSVQNNYHV
jgi:hypothetical protein